MYYVTPGDGVRRVIRVYNNGLDEARVKYEHAGVFVSVFVCERETYTSVFLCVACVYALCVSNPCVHAFVLSVSSLLAVLTALAGKELSFAVPTLVLTKVTLPWCSLLCACVLL